MKKVSGIKVPRTRRPVFVSRVKLKVDVVTVVIATGCVVFL